MHLAAIAAHGHGWRYDGPPWPVFPLLFLLVIGALITVAVLWARRSNPHADATAILSERYARGEIDDDEYHQRRAQLTRKNR